MPFNGSGVFTNIYNWLNDAAAGILIRADRMNAQDTDIATALTNTICRDGQTVITANLPMAGFRHTGVGNGVARTDYAALAQLQDGALFYLGLAGGTADVITINATPAFAAYVDGQRFIFEASGANTTAVTVALNGLTAKDLRKGYNEALVVGDILNKQRVEMVYNATDGIFQMISPIPYTNISRINVAETRSASINMADNQIIRPEIKDYAETKADVTAAATTTIDIVDGNVVNLAQAANITTFTWSNPSATGKACSFTLIRTKDATGTARTIAWPASVKWGGGAAPTITQTTGAVDVFTFITLNAGTTWYGFAGGLNFF